MIVGTGILENPRQLVRDPEHEAVWPDEVPWRSLRGGSGTVAPVVERLIVTRHAESECNVLGLVNGDPSAPCALTPRGRDQARGLGLVLAEQAIDLCVTTDFPRTQETADIALAGRNIPRLVMPELNDPPNGLLEGRPYEEHRRWRQERGPDALIPGMAETERQYLERLYAAVKNLLARPERSVLVIAHGMGVQWIVRASRRSDEPVNAGFAEAVFIDLQNLRAAFGDLDRDVYAFFTA